MPFWIPRYSSLGAADCYLSTVEMWEHHCSFPPSFVLLVQKRCKLTIGDPMDLAGWWQIALVDWGNLSLLACLPVTFPKVAASPNFTMRKKRDEKFFFSKGMSPRWDLTMWDIRWEQVQVSYIHAFGLSKSPAKCFYQRCHVYQVNWQRPHISNSCMIRPLT